MSEQLYFEDLEGYSQLDDKELQVLDFLIEGMDFRQVAFKLTCALRTAHIYMDTVLIKLDIDRQSDLKKYKFRNPK